MRGNEQFQPNYDKEKESERVQKEFVEWWMKSGTQSDYKLLTHDIESRCQNELERCGVQAVVSSRVKGIDSLRTKLDQRVSKSGKLYREHDDIISDIVDLAGVRVALYLPSHMDVVDELIQKQFYVFGVKEHGVGKGHEENEAKRGSTSTAYVPHFAGYRAKHYRVKLETPALPYWTKNSSNPVEVQVISMFNHTWAQVSHDLVYKEMKGVPSEEEIRILDGLDGLIRVGETLLQQLHDVSQRRIEAQNIPFQNEYKLASFLVAKETILQSWLPSILAKRHMPSEFHFGSMGPLLKLLTSARRNSPRDLEPYIEELGKSSILLDGPLRDHFPVQAQPPKLDLTILLMESVLSDENAVNQLKQNTTWSAETVIYQIRVLLGTLVLLECLFPPFWGWATMLFVEQKPGHSFYRDENLQWLHAEHLQVIAERNAPPTQELTHIEQSWKWFSTQQNGLIKFAFKLSTLVDFADFDRLSHFRKFLPLKKYQEEGAMVRDWRASWVDQQRGAISMSPNDSAASRFQGFVGKFPGGMGVQRGPVWRQPLSPQAPGYENLGQKDVVVPIDSRGGYRMGGPPQHPPWNPVHEQVQQYPYQVPPIHHPGAVQHPPPRPTNPPLRSRDESACQAQTESSGGLPANRSPKDK